MAFPFLTAPFPALAQDPELHCVVTVTAVREDSGESEPSAAAATREARSGAGSG